MDGQPHEPDAFDAFEAAGWEDRAEEYGRFLAPVTSRVIEPLLDDAAVGPGMHVLDVGCGPGHTAGACAARGATVVGVDIAGSMIKLARSLHPALDFRQADLQRLPFADASADAVVGNFSILHAGRPERAIAEFVRVLAPGGTLALSTWDAPERGRLAGVFVDAAHAAGATPLPSIPEGPPFFRFADGNEFTHLLADAGVHQVRVRTVAFAHRMASGDALWSAVLGGTVRMRALVFGQPEATRARIRAEFDRIVAEYANADGGLDIPVSVKIASGRRPQG